LRPTFTSARLSDRIRIQLPRESRYKIQIVSPDPSIDYKILVHRPDPSVDYTTRTLRTGCAGCDVFRGLQGLATCGAIPAL
jgi:hypothetical protein